VFELLHPFKGAIINLHIATLSCTFFSRHGKILVDCIWSAWSGPSRPLSRNFKYYIENCIKTSAYHQACANMKSLNDQ